MIQVRLKLKRRCYFLRQNLNIRGRMQKKINLEKSEHPTIHINPLIYVWVCNLCRSLFRFVFLFIFYFFIPDCVHTLICIICFTNSSSMSEKFTKFLIYGFHKSQIFIHVYVNAKLYKLVKTHSHTNAHMYICNLCMF